MLKEAINKAIQSFNILKLGQFTNNIFFLKETRDFVEMEIRKKFQIQSKEPDTNDRSLQEIRALYRRQISSIMEYNKFVILLDKLKRKLSKSLKRRLEMNTQLELYKADYIQNKKGNDEDFESTEKMKALLSFQKRKVKDGSATLNKLNLKGVVTSLLDPRPLMIAKIKNTENDVLEQSAKLEKIQSNIEEFKGKKSQCKSIFLQINAQLLKLGMRLHLSGYSLHNVLLSRLKMGEEIIPDLLPFEMTFPERKYIIDIVAIDFLRIKESKRRMKIVEQKTFKKHQIITSSYVDSSIKLG